MNTLINKMTRGLTSLSKIALICVLGVSVFTSSLAQSAAPPSGPGGNYPSAGPYPNTSWPYVAPAQKTTAIPTIDQNGAAYLPYLPWIATNVAALVNYSDFFYQLAKNTNGSGGNIPYNNSQTTAVNNFLNQTQASNMSASAASTTGKIQQFLSFGSQASNSLFGSLATLPGTDIALPCSGNNCPALPDNSAFNADSLFGVTGYPYLQSDGSTPTQQGKNIDNLILFLSNIHSTLPDPGLSTDAATRQNQLKMTQVQSYLLNIRSLVALQSMALSNFNFLAQERKIIPGLGTNAGMTVIPSSPDKCGDKPVPIADASQLQLDKYLLDRRLNNPCWYAAMNSASPEAVARETLYVMVEIQRQLYETQMLHERVLSTLSTMQMAMTQMGGSNLNVQASNIKACLSDPKQCSNPSG